MPTCALLFEHDTMRPCASVLLQHSENDSVNMCAFICASPLCIFCMLLHVCVCVCYHTHKCMHDVVHFDLFLLQPITESTNHFSVGQITCTCTLKRQRTWPQDHAWLPNITPTDAHRMHCVLYVHQARHLLRCSTLRHSTNRGQQHPRHRHTQARSPAWRRPCRLPRKRPHQLLLLLKGEWSKLRREHLHHLRQQQRCRLRPTRLRQWQAALRRRRAVSRRVRQAGQRMLLLEHVTCHQCVCARTHK
jgi:hypothetical protein